MLRRRSSSISAVVGLISANVRQNSATHAQCRPKFRFRPKLARTRPDCGDFGHVWPQQGQILAGCGRIGANSADFGPSAANYCPNLAEFDRCRRPAQVGPNINAKVIDLFCRSRC